MSDQQNQRRREQYLAAISDNNQDQLIRLIEQDQQADADSSPLFETLPAYPFWRISCLANSWSDKQEEAEIRRQALTHPIVAATFNGSTQMVLAMIQNGAPFDPVDIPEFASRPYIKGCRNVLRNVLPEMNNTLLPPLEERLTFEPAQVVLIYLGCIHQSREQTQRYLEAQEALQKLRQEHLRLWHVKSEK